MTDSQLMASVKAGSRPAFREIYVRHGGRVYAYLCRMVNDDALAEDLRQDAFIRLWQARSDWEDSGSVAGYLIRVSHNLALNANQRRQVRSRWAEQAARAPVTTALAPDVILERDRVAERVNTAIESLPERARHVFILKRDAGLSYNEIAAMLGISPRTVEVHLGKAYKLLREALSDIRD